MYESRVRNLVKTAITELKMILWEIEEYPELDTKLGGSGLKNVAETASKYYFDFEYLISVDGCKTQWRNSPPPESLFGLSLESKTCINWNRY
jgi:hypothetical protein